MVIYYKVWNSALRRYVSKINPYGRITWSRYGRVFYRRGAVERMLRLLLARYPNVNSSIRLVRFEEEEPTTV
jgi:hypothetical protein